jgi:hypothetical protein
MTVTKWEDVHSEPRLKSPRRTRKRKFNQMSTPMSCDLEPDKFITNIVSNKLNSNNNMILGDVHDSHNKLFDSNQLGYDADNDFIMHDFCTHSHAREQNIRNKNASTPQ